MKARSDVWPADNTLEFPSVTYSIKRMMINKQSIQIPATLHTPFHPHQKNHNFCNKINSSTHAEYEFPCK